MQCTFTSSWLTKDQVQHKNVFKRFVRLACDKHGTGLGLNIAAQIADLHKTNISLNNAKESLKLLLI